MATKKKVEATTTIKEVTGEDITAEDIQEAVTKNEEEVQRLGDVIKAKANLELAELGLGELDFVSSNKLEGFNVRGAGKTTEEMMADALRKGAKAASKGRPAYPA